MYHVPDSITNVSIGSTGPSVGLIPEFWSVCQVFLIHHQGVSHIGPLMPPLSIDPHFGVAYRAPDSITKVSIGSTGPSIEPSRGGFGGGGSDGLLPR